MNKITANELDIQVREAIKDIELYSLLDHFSLIGEGQKQEVFNKTDNPHLYYQWLASLMKVVKPKQVVELGAAAGISTILMALHMPKDSKLYSVDIDPQAWRWMNHDYSQVVKILGNDLDMNIWPKDIDLSKTDVWFIDSLHEEAQLRKEIELYSPFWKKGTIVVMDDIRMPELSGVWNELPYDKRETTNPNHFSGFGHFIV